MSREVILATGGTGGHVFPAVAVARLLARANVPYRIISDKRGQRYLPGDVQATIIDSASPSGSLLKKLTGVAKLAYATLRLHAGFLFNRPAVVAAFGGYASAPGLFAAKNLRVPIILHEQNAILGKANRMFARSARLIALSFAQTGSIEAAHRRVCQLVGNPVRPKVLEKMGQVDPDSPGHPFRLLVTGGSQGAAVFSKALPEALEQLPEQLRTNLFLTMQCREELLEKTRDHLTSLGIDHDIRPFFEDLPGHLLRTDLIISRSGASTMAELGVLGVPSLLLPYPHAADDHQRANARAFIEAGAAIMIDEEAAGKQIATHIASLMQDPERLSAMANAAKSLGLPDAAERLAAHIIQIAGIRLVEQTS